MIIKTIINDTKAYWNQYKDVKDIQKTPEEEPLRTCNVTSVAMIVNENPNDVLWYFINKYGYEIGVRSPHFQWQELLVRYIQVAGYEVKNNLITPQAYPDARNIKLEELKRMREEIDNGNIILYHKCGHYQVLVGYEIHIDGNIDYVFNDPAGDRRLPYKKRKRESGHLVRYLETMIISEPIYGLCYTIVYNGKG